MKKKRIVIIFGDPNSINYQIIFKNWKKLNSLNKKNELLNLYSSSHLSKIKNITLIEFL